MKFKRNFRQYIVKNTINQGFTLLELLIVVIIVGILAAVAIPSLLAQVGKSRESEAKNFISVANRTQQAYFMEKSDFAETLDALGVPVEDQNYYDFALISGPGKGMAMAQGKDNAKNGTRNYLGGIQYAKSTRTFDTIICRSLTGAYGLTNQGVVNDATTTPLQCSLAKMEIVR